MLTSGKWNTQKRLLFVCTFVLTTKSKTLKLYTKWQFVYVPIDKYIHFSSLSLSLLHSLTHSLARLCYIGRPLVFILNINSAYTIPMERMRERERNWLNRGKRKATETICCYWYYYYYLPLSLSLFRSLLFHTVCVLMLVCVLLLLLFLFLFSTPFSLFAVIFFLFSVVDCFY